MIAVLLDDRSKAMDRCAECGTEIQPEAAGMPRLPCPNCGKFGRNFSRYTSDNPGTAESVSWGQTRPGFQSVGQLTDKGRITLTATGPSPKNEDDAFDICSRFVRMRNANGDTWGEPKNGEQDVDWVSVDLP